ncbi:MAG TPA: STAS domain-containing protein [Actinomycetota bacterium]|nr:STAS domain-containing protein [Actinomycetota bacterium]
MELGLENRPHAGWTIVEVSGELDLHTSPGLRDHVLHLIDGGDRRIALDLTKVGFMDSSSLGVLITCLKRMREHDGRLVLFGVQSTPMKVLQLTGLDRVFEIVGSAAELQTP